MEELMILEFLDGVSLIYILVLSFIISLLLNRLFVYVDKIKKVYIPVLNLFLSFILVYLTYDYEYGVKLYFLNVLLVTGISTYGYDLIYNTIKIIKK